MQANLPTEVASLSSVFGIVHADSDGLLRNIKPLVGHSLLQRLLSHLPKVGPSPVRGRKSLWTLQHHVQERLKMHDLVLKAKPNRPSYVARNVGLADSVQAQKPGSNAVLVGENIADSRPCIWHFGMIMTFGRIIDVRVDAPFEDVPVLCWMSCRLSGGFRQLYIQECRDMSQVEYARIAELDGFLIELLVREHLAGDNIPCSPKRPPILDRGKWAGGVEFGYQGEGKLRLKLMNA